MKRWWLTIALLLSLGLNLGLVAQKAQAKRRAILAEKAALAETAAPATPTPTPAPPTATPTQPAATAPTETAPAKSTPTRAPSPDAAPTKPPGPTAEAPLETLALELEGDEPAGPRRRSPAGARPAQVERFIERIADEVGVFGEKRRQFVALQQHFFDQTRELRQQHRHHRVQFRESMMAERPQREVALRHLAQMGQSQQALEKAFVDNYFASCELLDRAQAAKFRRIIVRLRQMRWDRADGESLERPRFRSNEELQEPRRSRRRPPAS